MHKKKASLLTSSIRERYLSLWDADGRQTVRFLPLRKCLAWSCKHPLCRNATSCGAALLLANEHTEHGAQEAGLTNTSCECWDTAWTILLHTHKLTDYILREMLINGKFIRQHASFTVLPGCFEYAWKAAKWSSCRAFSTSAVPTEVLWRISDSRVSVSELNKTER